MTLQDIFQALCLIIGFVLIGVAVWEVGKTS